MPLPPVPVPNALLRAVVGARGRIQGLADRLVPAEAALWDLVAGMQRTKFAGALVQSGIADALYERPREAECEGGRERSPAEVHELMQAAGIVPGRVRHAGVHMLVEGTAG